MPTPTCGQEKTAKFFLPRNKTTLQNEKLKLILLACAQRRVEFTQLLFFFSFATPNTLPLNIVIKFLNISQNNKSWQIMSLI